MGCARRSGLRYSQGVGRLETGNIRVARLLSGGQLRNLTLSGQKTVVQGLNVATIVGGRVTEGVWIGEDCPIAVSSASHDTRAHVHLLSSRGRIVAPRYRVSFDTRATRYSSVAFQLEALAL